MVWNAGDCLLVMPTIRSTIGSDTVLVAFFGDVPTVGFSTLCFDWEMWIENTNWLITNETLIKNVFKTLRPDSFVCRLFRPSARLSDPVDVGLFHTPFSVTICRRRCARTCCCSYCRRWTCSYLWAQSLRRSRTDWWWAFCRVPEFERYASE